MTQGAAWWRMVTHGDAWWRRVTQGDAEWRRTMRGNAWRCVVFYFWVAYAECDIELYRWCWCDAMWCCVDAALILRWCCADAALIYCVDIALYYGVVMWMWCWCRKEIGMGYLGRTTNRQRCQMIRTTSVTRLMRGLLLSSSFFHHISSSSN